MKVELGLADLPGFVRDVAAVAAHVEGGMAAAFLGHVHAGLMTAQAQVLFLVPCSGLQQLILIVRGVRVMTLHAIAHGWGVDGTFYVGRILVRMAGQTESIGTGRDQLYPSDIFIGANFMATGAAHGHRRVDRLAFGLVLMAGNAGGGVGLRVKWDRMFRGIDAASKDEYREETG